MRKLSEFVWGGVIGCWLAVGMYAAGRFGVWALAWFAGGIMAVELWRRGVWWVRCRQYRRLLEERWDDDVYEAAA